MSTSTASNENGFNCKDLFETMDLGVVYRDSGGNIITANPAAEKILGLSLNQMKGRTSIHPEWRAVDRDKLDLPGEQHPAMLALQTGKKKSTISSRVFTTHSIKIMSGYWSVRFRNFVMEVRNPIRYIQLFWILLIVIKLKKNIKP